MSDSSDRPHIDYRDIEPGDTSDRKEMRAIPEFICDVCGDRYYRRTPTATIDGEKHCMDCYNDIPIEKLLDDNASTQATMGRWAA